MDKQKRWEIIFIIIAFIMTFWVMTTGAFFSKKVNLNVGQIAPEDVYATIQIENEIATKRRREIAEQNIPPVYTINSGVLEQGIENIQLLFEYIETLRSSNIMESSEPLVQPEKQEGLGESVEEVLQMIPPENVEAQVLQESEIGEVTPPSTNENQSHVESTTDELMKPLTDDRGAVSKLEVLQERSPIPLYEDEYRTLLNTNQEDLNALERIIIDIITQTLEEGINSEANTSLHIRAQLENTKLTSIYQKVAYEIINSQIKPNIIIDEEATALQKEKVGSMIESDYVLQGEKIIGQGDRITEETHLLLAKIGYLESEAHEGYAQYVGLGVLILIFIGFFIHYIQSVKEIERLQLRQSSLVFILYLISLGFIAVLKPANFIFLPLSTASLLVAILIQKDLALIFHFILVIIATMTHKGDATFVLYLLLTGMIGISLAGEVEQRKRVMRSALMIGVLYGGIYIVINLVSGILLDTELILIALQALLMGVIQVVVVVGSLPVWEGALQFVTPGQLLELTNPDQPLLKRMLLEATGTYYHSLLVANLAEAAADKIEADPLLARVGGYYHDIGKLNCSNYFKENQVLENPHDYMEPKASAKVIISHATSGLELANAYKLPQCVKDMIIQHHGMGVVQYFYVKAQKDDEKVSITDFRYPGPKPQTKEAALIMLADVVEATVRAMQHKIGVEMSVEDIVRKMVKQKLEEGQLDECPLYISDIEKIIESFSKVLKGMYHERIEYPDKKG